ncbi:hypothetical protein QO008_000669 [Peptoniphilus ivorii]|uniref:hypothetical protein n=1 Tax=Aedoeadaptatus ivorii TaxID=54006 RepID=UPI00277D3CC8|nr:hypothetical protein [Peptoniphilus ivorii]MDQ0508220.1 hypothetical protein [Peptoniphilus ivorii]
MAVAIREGRASDAGAVLAFLRQVGGETDFLSYGAEGIGISLKEGARFLEGMRDEKNCLFLIAWDGETLLGTLSLAGASGRMAHRAELGMAVAKDA